MFEEWVTSSMWVWLFMGPYLLILGVVCLYGLHRYHLVHLYYKYRRNTPNVTNFLSLSASRCRVMPSRD